MIHSEGSYWRGQKMFYFKVDFQVYLPSGKLTWQWKISIYVGNTSSNGPIPIAMLVYQSVPSP